MPKFQHLPHPTDTRRTVGHYYKTACNRWAGWSAFSSFLTSTPCPKCAAEMLIVESATTETK